MPSEDDPSGPIWPATPSATNEGSENTSTPARARVNHERVTSPSPAWRRAPPATVRSRPMPWRESSKLPTLGLLGSAAAVAASAAIRPMTLGALADTDVELDRVVGRIVDRGAIHRAGEARGRRVVGRCVDASTTHF